MMDTKHSRLRISIQIHGVEYGVQSHCHKFEACFQEFIKHLQQAQYNLEIACNIDPQTVYYPVYTEQKSSGSQSRCTNLHGTFIVPRGACVAQW